MICLKSNSRSYESWLILSLEPYLLKFDCKFKVKEFFLETCSFTKYEGTYFLVANSLVGRWFGGEVTRISRLARSLAAFVADFSGHLVTSFNLHSPVIKSFLEENCCFKMIVTQDCFQVDSSLRHKMTLRLTAQNRELKERYKCVKCSFFSPLCDRLTLFPVKRGVVLVGWLDKSDEECFASS